MIRRPPGRHGASATTRIAIQESPDGVGVVRIGPVGDDVHAVGPA